LGTKQLAERAADYRCTQNATASLPAELNKFAFKGQQFGKAGDTPAIDFDLYSLSGDAREFCLGSWAHNVSHLIRYYGWYSNKTRGQRAQRQPAAAAGTGIPARSPTAREARQGWAALIKQVSAADPICCPKCGTTMRIVAFLGRHQTEVIEKILRHCGLWDEPSARAPPAAKVPVTG
jgi:hypothetical protein